MAAIWTITLETTPVYKGEEHVGDNLTGRVSWRVKDVRTVKGVVDLTDAQITALGLTAGELLASSDDDLRAFFRQAADSLFPGFVAAKEADAAVPR